MDTFVAPVLKMFCWWSESTTNTIFILITAEWNNAIQIQERHKMNQQNEVIFSPLLYLLYMSNMS